LLLPSIFLYSCLYYFINGNFYRKALKEELIDVLAKFI